MRAAFKCVYKLETEPSLPHSYEPKGTARSGQKRHAGLVFLLDLHIPVIKPIIIQQYGWSAKGEVHHTQGISVEQAVDNTSISLSRPLIS